MTAPAAPAPTTAPQQTAPVTKGPNTPTTPDVFSPTRNSIADAQINDSSDEQFAEMFGLKDMVEAAKPQATPPVGQPVATPAAQTTPATPTEPVATEPAVTVDAEGRKHGPDGKFLPGEAEKPAVVAATPETPAAPEKPKVKLATEFKIADEVGELDVEDTSSRLKISFKADDQDLKDVPLDKVVRYAQRGVYQERLHQEAQQARTQAAQLEQQTQQLQNVVQEYEQFFERAMTDDQFVLASRKNYAQRNSPEERARRAEAELQQMKQGHQLTQEQQQSRAIIERDIYPVFNEAVEAVKDTVPFEEAFGRFNGLILPYLVNGRVPPSRLPEVARRVQQELVPWMESTHESRLAARSQQTQQRDSATKAAQQQATLLKRQLARAVAPSPAAPPALRESAKPKKFTSARAATDEFDPSVPIAGE